MHLTPETKVSAVSDCSTPRFRVEIPEKDPILLSAETDEAVKAWVDHLNSIRSNTLSMDDFNILSVLGRGHYGKVMLVQKKDTGELFALKTIQKSKLAANGKSQSVLIEKNIMMKAAHPFIVNLCFSFQTASKFYMGLEYASGGELFYHLDQIGVVPIDDTRLYIAEIGLALSHLHSIGIIYRDLKPENILFDENGHIKITDFGLSKDIGDMETTTTFCGTSEYLAPELILQKPYSYPVDIWALGILTYEMLIGTTPFYDDNRTKMYANIISAEPYFPKSMDRRIIDFIQKLLTKNPKKRPTFDELKSHPFFEGFDWIKVINKEYRPNFVPQTKDSHGTSNFDPQFTSEIAADSFVPSAFGNIPGFSYTECHINNIE